VSKVLEFLGEKFVNDLITANMASLTNCPLETADEIDRIIRTGNPDQGYGFRRALAVATLASTAALEHVRGDDSASVRSRFAEAVGVWVPVAERLEFPERDYEAGGFTKAKADWYKDNFQAEISPSAAGHHYRSVKWKNLAQPEIQTTATAFLSALISGEADLIRQIALPYRLRPLARMPSQSGADRWKVLLLLAQGHSDEADALLANIPRGYAADPPPERMEMLDGLVHEDPALLTVGLYKTTTAFRGKGDPKKYQTASVVRRYGPFEKQLPKLRNALVGFGWHFAIFAIAALALAHRRGLTAKLGPKAAWSEWVPKTLVDSGST
jgi:hypothetical protein